MRIMRETLEEVESQLSDRLGAAGLEDFQLASAWLARSPARSLMRPKRYPAGPPLKPSCQLANQVIQRR